MGGPSIGQWEREEFCGTIRFNCVQYAAVFILYRRAQRT
jgi:hypothetical protein